VITGVVIRVSRSLLLVPLSLLLAKSNKALASEAGACVSMPMTGVVPAPPGLPAALAYEPLATVMTALPFDETVGVKTAV
jgi:hypothetical protein